MSFVTKTVVKDLPKQGLWTLGAFHFWKGITLVCGKFEAKIWRSKQSKPGNPSGQYDVN